MMETQLAKAKRPVTSCHECYRRKQKCNRQKPCNHCIYRNVQSRCVYAPDPSETPSPALSNDDSLSSSTTSPGSRTPGQNASRLGLQYQLGYPSAPASNTFADLQEGMPDDHGLVASHSVYFAHVTDLSKASQAPLHLPPKPILNALIDLYFEEANWYMQILTRYHFDLLLDISMSDDQAFRTIRPESSPQELRCFPALLYQLTSIALLFMPSSSDIAKSMGLLNDSALDRLAERYSEKGEQLMNSLGRRRPSLTAIQHDILRSAYLKNSSRGAEAWYPLGSALRQAQDMGLHLLAQTPHVAGEDVGEALLRFWFEEHKRRIWVTLVIWDSHMSTALGRPRNINMSDCTTKTPIDCEFPLDPSKTVPMGPPLDGPPSTYTGQLFIYALSYKIHEVLSSGANKVHVKDYLSVQRIHTEVLSLMDNLPPVVRPRNPDRSWDARTPHIARVRELIASVGNITLLWLHRPHSPLRVESRDAAVEAALRALESQQRWMDLTIKHRYKLFTLSLYTFDAAVFLAAFLLRHRSDERLSAEIHAALRLAIRRLGLMREGVPMAKSAEQVLIRYYQIILDEQTKDPALMGFPDVTRTPGASDADGLQGNSNGYQLDGQQQEQQLPRISEDLIGFTAGTEHSEQQLMEAFDPSLLDLPADEMLDLDLPTTSDIFDNITAPEYHAATWMQAAYHIDGDNEDPVVWIH